MALLVQLFWEGGGGTYPPDFYADKAYTLLLTKLENEVSIHHYTFLNQTFLAVSYFINGTTSTSYLSKHFLQCTLWCYNGFIIVLRVSLSENSKLVKWLKWLSYRSG